jgi:hypothetical protein
MALGHYIKLPNTNIGTQYRVKVNAKQSHYRTGQTLGLQEVEALRISGKSALEDGKVVSPTYRPPLLPGNIPGTNFC